MDSDFTGQYSRHSRIHRQPIHVGDLVTLSLPRKERINEIIIFKVVKEDDTYKIEYFSGAMSDGDPGYIQDLHAQVYKVIGNEKTGIDESQLT